MLSYAHGTCSHTIKHTIEFIIWVGVARWVSAALNTKSTLSPSPTTRLQHCSPHHYKYQQTSLPTTNPVYPGQSSLSLSLFLHLLCVVSADALSFTWMTNGKHRRRKVQAAVPLLPPMLLS